MGRNRKAFWRWWPCPDILPVAFHEWDPSRTPPGSRFLEAVHTLRHCAPTPAHTHTLPEAVPIVWPDHHLYPHPHPLQGVKEFKCEVCGREFTLQANMKRHMLIHTSVRPYQCHICFKTFVQKQTLKTHMIVHSPVKPFKCKVWGCQRPWAGHPQGWPWVGMMAAAGTCPELTKQGEPSLG